MTGTSTPKNFVLLMQVFTIASPKPETFPIAIARAHVLGKSLPIVQSAAWKLGEASRNFLPLKSCYIKDERQKRLSSTRCHAVQTTWCILREVYCSPAIYISLPTVSTTATTKFSGPIFQNFLKNTSRYSIFTPLLLPAPVLNPP